MSSRQSVFVGDRFQNKSGLWLEVVEYVTGKKIRVRFDESGYECVVEGQELRRRCVVDAHAKYPAVGDKYTMKQNGVLEVVEYRNTREVLVRFLDTGFETVTEACQLFRGTVKDLMLPRVCGVGFIGVGPYAGCFEGTRKVVWAYQKWLNMLERCYDPATEQQAYNYAGVTVWEPWHNYQNFAAWATQQKGYGNERWAMEKDLLVKGNRYYHPDVCCFLPQELNNQMLKSEKARGDYPIGVTLNKPNGKFIAHLAFHKEGDSSHIGIYNTVNEAFEAYKFHKEKRLKDLANKWKDQIDDRAYQALINYQVEITD